MNSFFSEFINSMPLDEYIKKVNGRKIAIWGASSAGKELYKILVENGQQVSIFIDKNAELINFKFCGHDVKTNECLNKDEYFVFVAVNYYEVIEEELIERGYSEIQDYLYILHKPIRIKTDEKYVDEYGNQIEVPKEYVGRVINFIGYNSKFIVEDGCELNKNNKFYSCNSTIHLSERCIIGENVNLISYKDSSIYIESDSKIESECFLYSYNNSKIRCGKNNILKNNVNFMASNFSSILLFEANLVCQSSQIKSYENSYVEINNKNKIYSNCLIECYKESSIILSSDSEFNRDMLMKCFINSNLFIGESCRIDDNSRVVCYDESNLSIGNNTTFETGLVIINCYDGEMKIGNNVMVSLMVSICNNDGHPIFDMNNSRQINKNKAIIIEDHVWLGIKSSIMSQVHIHKNSIVGANSLVRNQKIINNCIVAGVPAKVIRTNIVWDRQEREFSKINKDYIEQSIL